MSGENQTYNYQLSDEKRQQTIVFLDESNETVSIHWLNQYRFGKWLSVKPQVGGSFSSNILRWRGSSDADVRTFWWKNIGFFEIYGMSARTREVEQVRTRGEESIFREFVRTSFMDGP